MSTRLVQTTYYLNFHLIVKLHRLSASSIGFLAEPRMRQTRRQHSHDVFFYAYKALDLYVSMFLNLMGIVGFVRLFEISRKVSSIEFSYPQMPKRCSMHYAIDWLKCLYWCQAHSYRLSSLLRSLPCHLAGTSGQEYRVIRRYWCQNVGLLDNTSTIEW